MRKSIPVFSVQSDRIHTIFSRAFVCMFLKNTVLDFALDWSFPNLTFYVNHTHIHTYTSEPKT